MNDKIYCVGDLYQHKPPWDDYYYLITRADISVVFYIMRAKNENKLYEFLGLYEYIHENSDLIADIR